MSAPVILEQEIRKRDQRWQRNDAPTTSGRLFQTQTFAECLTEAATRPPARRLAGPLLLEGELVLCFGDTGTGKTVFGVQSGNDIAGGKSTTGLEVESEGLRTLLIDFELSDSQHVQRYSLPVKDVGYTDLYEFSADFFRATISTVNIRRTFDASKWHEILLNEIERVIIESEARVVLLDNITYLASETEKQKFALPLMQTLNEIKKRPPGCSMIVFAHTPKRDETKPISINDLAGSKTLANFADSIFALGKSSLDKDQRYIKQLKVRSGQLVYDANSVALFNFTKPDNFLGFTYVGQAREVDHLKSIADTSRGELIIKAKEMRDQGMSQRQIAHELGKAVSTVNKYLKLVEDVNTATDNEICFPPDMTIEEIDERWAIEHEGELEIA
jgi:KaiC/GvpD/RAD55 family RecA-like ATPase